MNKEYRICSKCIMDTSDINIFFNVNGICNHCLKYNILKTQYGYKNGVSEKKLDAIIADIKQAGQKRKYDVVLGISGGVDSAYLAHLANSKGLRILAVHVDAGWNTDTAVSNIEKLCDNLKIDLHTIVLDWDTIKELQRAYMFSGLPNLDVPQDHAFLAAVYKFARKNKVRYMLNGSNLATESILPDSWGYKAMDFASIKSVYKKHGRGLSLSKYPKLNIFELYLHRKAIKRINLLNYVDYSKKSAMKFLKDNYDWEYYGGKHFESIFTRFFQSHYLPLKFGYNKKRAHLSSLVVSNELDRNEALKLMEDDEGYTIDSKIDDQTYILNKLEIGLSQWNEIIVSKNKSEDDYKNQKKLKNALYFFKKIFK